MAGLISLHLGPAQPGLRLGSGEQALNSRRAILHRSTFPSLRAPHPGALRVAAKKSEEGESAAAADSKEVKDGNGAHGTAVLQRQESSPFTSFFEQDEAKKLAKEQRKKEKKEKKEQKGHKEEAEEEGEEEGEGEEQRHEHEHPEAMMYLTESEETEKHNKKKKKKDKEQEREEEGSSSVEGSSGSFLAKAHYPDDAAAHAGAASKDGKAKKKMDYEKELDKLQVELVKLQEWVRKKKLRVVVIFEGRDAAGKGGIIKTIAEACNPRVVSIKALAAPSDRERTQWYFQRYVAELPAGGEMVLFDRSWYNRAGVERVMGFCTDQEYKEFLRSCPEFERMLVRSGLILIKYWISVSPEEQERRFKQRLGRPEKRWKLSEMDLQSRARWADYSQAKDIMFSYTDIKQAPWFVVPADNKKAARLNCISHLVNEIPHEDLIVPNDLELPPLQEDHYIRPPITDQTFVPQAY